MDETQAGNEGGSIEGAMDETQGGMKGARGGNG